MTKRAIVDTTEVNFLSLMVSASLVDMVVKAVTVVKVCGIRSLATFPIHVAQVSCRLVALEGSLFTEMLESENFFFRGLRIGVCEARGREVLGVSFLHLTARWRVFRCIEDNSEF